MAWLTGWTYRKAITVTNASADYQTKILIGKTSDAVGEDVDCGGNIADDFDDLRFTAADGSTLLDYWIESIADSGGTKLATVWVQNNATPDTTLYMYYSGTETAVSDGASTFIAFDDFEWGNNGDPIDDNGGSVTWTITVGDVDISTEQAYGGTRSMKLIGAASQPSVTMPHTAGTGYAIRYRIYKEDAGAHQLVHGDGSTRSWMIAYDDEDLEYYDTELRDTGVNITADQWELLESNAYDWGGNTYDWYHNDVRIADDASMHSSVLRQDVVFLSGFAVVGADVWIDDFIIRKWAATEPSFAFGAETTEGWPNISHVKGVAAASISHKKGVAVADISHVKGVEV
jgi:hypothetical protein